MFTEYALYITLMVSDGGSDFFMERSLTLQISQNPVDAESDQLKAFIKQLKRHIDSLFQKEV